MFDMLRSSSVTSGFLTLVCAHMCSVLLSHVCTHVFCASSYFLVNTESQGSWAVKPCFSTSVNRVNMSLNSVLCAWVLACMCAYVLCTCVQHCRPERGSYLLEQELQIIRSDHVGLGLEGLSCHCSSKNYLIIATMTSSGQCTKGN